MEKTKIETIGLMAVSDYMYAPEMAARMKNYCDEMIYRFDVLTGDYNVIRRCVNAVPDAGVIVSVEKWNRWNWRQELLDAAVEGYEFDYVLFLDSDEAFENYQQAVADIDAFKKSGADFMMFDYEMIVDDYRKPKKYPGCRHCKLYRYRPGMSYRPYQGYARPTIICQQSGRIIQPKVYNAQVRIGHYCFYTAEMERKKELHK